MAHWLAIQAFVVHIWTMLKAGSELASELGARIRRRRCLLGWTQADAASRAGVSYRTWRRMEAEGKASIEDCVKAAIALRCESGIEALFPEPAAISLDDLLHRQQGGPATRPASRSRAVRS